MGKFSTTWYQHNDDGQTSKALHFEKHVFIMGSKGKEMSLLVWQGREPG